MNRPRLALLASLTLGSAFASTLLYARPAEACGGCFVPPENNTVVTDHRMILSVAQGQSTLYDQIRYQGAPESFAWVLPITGEAQVGLSADVVFSALDAMTQVAVVAPPRNCPPPPDCDAFGKNAAAPSAAGGDSSGGGVTVTKSEVVGPYETVQLQATNPQALNDWLQANGFALPNDVKPVVAAYVVEHFNFLAMKLRPGASVKSMRPVRVTTPGSSVTLPLRMVAAGTGATVGISLWVLGQGRYEPTNFPQFTIKADELAWDWVKNASNFKEIRAQKTAAAGGRGWELETSLSLPLQQLDNAIRTGFFSGPGGPGGPGGPQPGTSADADYAPIPASEGKPAKTAAEVRDEDLGVLLGRLVPGAELRTTRLRADLAHAALTEDLVLAASADQSQLGNTRQVTRELNEPICPVYDGCDVVGQAPRSEAGGGSSSSAAASRSNCATASGDASSGGALFAGLGALGLVVGRLRRRRSA
ncbi:MAG TPA: DUF2330 domain-containing protein [Polyangiaceae bacterium]|nr:DUF2330 domain-containing protein [Polyangiaceae bacterium]